MGFELDLDEYERLTDLIYRKAGIRFENKKLYFLSKRVQKRMESTGMDTPLEYIRFLTFRDRDGSEMQSLLNLLTINETYFFRDFPQLQAFAEHSLQEVLQRKAAKGDRRLRIWSAGCSSGEEPYTLAIICLEMIEDLNHWDVEILATDIDDIVLKRARVAAYSERSVKDVPREYLMRYFDTRSNGTFYLAREVKRMVRFEHLNLFDKNRLREKGGFDFIFCRNVLIYFDDVSRKQVVDHFYVALNSGGYIFLGSSESAGRITTAFKVKKAGDYLVYFKG